MDNIKRNIFAFWNRYKETGESIWARDIWRLLADAYPTIQFQRLWPRSGDCALRLPSLKNQGKFVRFSFDQNEPTAENVDKLINMFERRGTAKEFSEDEIEARKQAEKKDLSENGTLIHNPDEPIDSITNYDLADKEKDAQLSAYEKEMFEGYDPDSTFMGKPDPYGCARDAAEERDSENRLRKTLRSSASFSSYEEFKNWQKRSDNYIHEAHIYFNNKEGEFKYEKETDDDIDIIVYPSELTYEDNDIGYGATSGGLVPDGPLYCYCPSYLNLEEIAYDYIIDHQRVEDKLIDDMYEPLPKKQIKEMKNIRKINESQLKAIVAESVKRILRENFEPVPEYDNVNNEDIARFNDNYTEVTVPEYCLPYLVNGDMEGYSEEEMQQMQDFENKWNGKLKNGLNIGDVCVPLDGRNPSFEPSNDIWGNMGADCYRFLVPLK